MSGITLNEYQLKLLFDGKYQLLLAHLTEPRTPSQLAAALQLPLGTIHYRLNRLLHEGLVHQVAKVSRTATFQLGTTEFLVPSELLPSLRDIHLSRVKANLRKLQEDFIDAMDAHYEQLLTKGEEAVTISFGKQPVAKPFTPQLRIWELRLEEHAFSTLLDKFVSLASDDKNGSSGITCTLAVFLFPRR